MGSYYVNHFTHFFFHLKIWQWPSFHVSKVYSYIITVTINHFFLFENSCAYGFWNRACLLCQWQLFHSLCLQWWLLPTFTPLSLLLSFQLFFQFGTKLPVRYFHFSVLLSLQESPNLCSLFKAVSPSNWHVCCWYHFSSRELLPEPPLSYTLLFTSN